MKGVSAPRYGPRGNIYTKFRHCVPASAIRSPSPLFQEVELSRVIKMLRFLNVVLIVTRRLVKSVAIHVITQSATHKDEKVVTYAAHCHRCIENFQNGDVGFN